MNEIELKHIVSNSDNCRESALNLQGMGYGIVQPIEGAEKPALFDLALGSPEDQERYCELIERHEAELVGLAENIDQQGQLQNCRVRSVGMERFSLTFGARRCLAVLYLHAKHGKPAKVAATISQADETAALIESAAENVHLPLSYLDQGRLFKRLRERGLSVKEIAKVYPMGKATEQNIRHRIRLLELPVEVQLKVHHGKLSQEVALKLLAKTQKKNDTPLQPNSGQTICEESPLANEGMLDDKPQVGRSSTQRTEPFDNDAELKSILQKFNDEMGAFDIDSFSPNDPIELNRLTRAVQKKLKAIQGKMLKATASKNSLALCR